MRQPNRARLRLWVAALRSGQYEQGKRALAILDSESGTRRYCCLGVACEVAIANGLDITTNSDYWKAYDGADLALPQSVIDWYGLAEGHEDPEFDNPEDPDADAEAASTLNDDWGWSFDQIAKAVESTFKLKEETDEPAE